MIHPGWRIRFSADPKWGVGRQVKLVAARDDARDFELGFTVRQSATPLIRTPSMRLTLPAKDREHYLSSSPLLGLEHKSIVNEIKRLSDNAQSNDALLNNIFTRARALLPRSAASNRSIPEVLGSGRALPLERAYVMVALCRAANIPARLVTGVMLAETTNVQLHHWVEVFTNGSGWSAYDPLLGYQKDLPSNFLPFVKNRADLVEVVSDHGIEVTYTLTNVDEFLGVQARTGPSWQNIFYLTRLPLEVRNVLAHLFLLPLAVFITALFREVTGIRSYGTFMPALFALAMTQAEWHMATVTLAVVLFFGVLGRAALPAKLRRQPRLTAVLILVVLGVSGSVSLMAYFSLPYDGRVLLLPIVITAILVDLFYKALEKEGAASAFMKLGWTMLQVILCLPVMQYESLGHWFVAHPETHLLTLAICLSITAYRGQRLVDLPRFHWLNRLPSAHTWIEKK
jgi:hypothetical protein